MTAEATIRGCGRKVVRIGRDVRAPMLHGIEDEQGRERSGDREKDEDTRRCGAAIGHRFSTRRCKGVVEKTFSRGKLIVDGDTFLGSKDHGKYLSRSV